ncbi:MAG: helix-turn-helix transcriptional regulator [Bacteroidota bacterium]
MNRLLLIFIWCFYPLLLMAAGIRGQVNLPDEWAPVIYLSVIHSFDDLQTASYDFLRYQTDIDEGGFFTFEDLELAAEDRIYRLHICKKGDPVSTIILGGQEENFIHFVMNKYSEIALTPNGRQLGLGGYVISGQPKGVDLSKLSELERKLNTPPALPSAQNRDFIKHQVFSQLNVMVDTASNTIMRLLALHIIQERYAAINHLDLMERIYADLADSSADNPYFNAFANQLQFQRFQANNQSPSGQSTFQWLVPLVLLVLLIGGYLWWTSTKRGAVEKTDPTQLVQTLSKQEKRVLNLLKKGKTNKEISSELHIEVSTVKSHLHKIYSRLGVKSRKEIINRDL